MMLFVLFTFALICFVYARSVHIAEWLPERSFVCSSFLLCAMFKEENVTTYGGEKEASSKREKQGKIEEMLFLTEAK